MASSANAIPGLERCLGLREHRSLRVPRSRGRQVGRATPLRRPGRQGEAALPLLEQAAERAGRGNRIFEALATAYLGEAYVLADRLGDALEVAGRALTLARERGQRGYEAWALRLLGEVAARRDPPEHADGHYRDALALAEELGMRPLVAHCHLGLGKLSRRTGKREQARDHLTTATTMYRDMDMPFWLTKAEEELTLGG